MNPREYLELLLQVYLFTMSYPLVNLVTIDDGEHVQVKYKSAVERVFNYNLGFRLGLVSWITGKRSKKNADLLRNILSPDNDTLLLSVVHTSNYCKIYLYDRFGQVVQKHKLKYMSINLFKLKLKGSQK